MKLVRTFFLSLVITTVALAATTGSISGKVSGIPSAKAAPGAFPPPPLPAVVFAVPIPAKAAPAAGKAYAVNQEYTEFQPAIIAVPEGATITFKNDDTVNHNVELFTVGGKLIKDLGVHPPDQSVTYRPSSPGPIHLRCKLHPGMSGWVYVAPTPYMTVTKSNGQYTLNNLPDGKYRVVVWHPGVAQQDRVVTVADHQTVNFNLKK